MSSVTAPLSKTGNLHRPGQGEIKARDYAMTVQRQHSDTFGSLTVQQSLFVSQQFLSFSLSPNFETESEIAPPDSRHRPL
jgi:hypothetical protein